MHPAQALDRQQGRAAFLANLGELRVGHQVIRRDAAKGGGHGRLQDQMTP